jgi:hypothetical protein
MGLLRYLREAVSGRLCDAIIAAKNLAFAFIATGICTFVVRRA